MAKTKGVEVPLRFLIDQQSLTKTESGIDDINSSLMGLDKSLDVISTSANGTTKALTSMASRGEDSLEAYQKQIKKTENLLKGMHDQEKKSSGTTGAFSKIGSGTSAIGQVAGGLGLSGVQDIAMMASNLAQAAEQIPRMAEAIRALSGAAGTGTTAVVNMSTAATVATPAVAGVGLSLGAVLVAALPIAVALAGVAIALQAFMETVNKSKASLENAIDAQELYFTTIETGTIESVQASLKQKEAQLRVKQAMYEQIKAQYELAKVFDWFTGSVLKKNMDEYAAAASDLQMEIDALNRALDSGKLSNEASTEAIQTSTSSAQQQTAAEQRRAEALNEAKAAAEKQRQAEEERARALRQYAQEVAQLKQREMQAEAEASRNRTQKMVDIARQFAQSSADALRKMQEDQATLTEKYGQEQADTMLAAQRDDEMAAREHYRSIKGIRDKAALDEFNAARDRDFARLVEIRRGVEQQVSEESERFATEREEANIALKQRLRDSAVAYQRERSARLQDYNTQINDLKIAKQRQQQEARLAHQRELANLRQKLNDEIALKNSALQQTLNATQSWANQMARAVGAAPIGGTPGGTSTGLSGAGGMAGFASRAAGGPLAAGQLSLVNELWRESFMSGGRSVMLPHGMGMFMPLRSGKVKAAGGAVVNMTINAAPGMSESRVAQIANEKIAKTLEELIA